MLTSVQKEIVEHMSLGLQTKSIAYIMKMKDSTIETYKQYIFKKLSVKNGPECVAFCLRNGIIK